MLLDYLERVREKPRAARKRFAFFVAAGVTVLIGGIWMFSLPARFATLGNVGEGLVGSPEASQIGEQIDQGKQGVQDAITTGQHAVDAMPPEMKQELLKQGYMGAGSGATLGQGAGTNTVATSSVSGGGVLPTAVQSRSIVLIATTSSQTATTASAH